MSFGARELLILLLIAVVLFGARKLPDLARSVGRSMRILKAETKGLQDDEEETRQTPPPGDQASAARPRPAQGEPERRGPQPEPDYPELAVSYEVVEEPTDTSHRPQGR